MEDLSASSAGRILVRLHSLTALDEPQSRCEALAGPLAGLWRLRVGDHRVVLDIQRRGLVIIALDAGDRSSIHDK